MELILKWITDMYISVRYVQAQSCNWTRFEMVLNNYVSFLIYDLWYSTYTVKKSYHKKKKVQKL